MKKYLLVGSILGIALVAALTFLGSPVVGSVADDGIYYYQRITSSHATTSPLLVRQGSGVLGSVVISSSTVGTLDIYDGTTMPVKTLLGAATSIATTSATTTIASFAASSANGTYTFDTAFSNSLTIMPSATFNGAFTITYR